MTGLKVSRQYDTYLRVELRMSPNTVDAYLREVLKLETFLDSSERNWADLDALLLEDYLINVRQKDQNLSPRTLSRILSSLRSLMEYLQLVGIRTDNPLNGIDMPRITPDTS